jgi:DNA-binding transcriptional MocR family regulator
MYIYEKIRLEKKNSEHLYMQLYKQLKDLIISGKLKTHSKLPPIRKLSSILEVNNVTIVNAYRLLEQEGLVYKKIGSGTYVKEVNERNVKANSLMVDNEESIFTFNNEYNEEQKDLNNKSATDFASGIPTPDLFPIIDFKTVLNEVLDRDKGNAFGYQESQGYFPLRKEIKNYVTRYNINTQIDNIQIISGAQQGIDIIAKTLIDYGDIVFTESPTYTGAIAAFKSRSARIIEIPMLKDGIDIKELENKLKVFTPKFIYVMSNFQNPTGFTYSISKRNKLLELANIYDFFIIEDDYLSELAFTCENYYPLKSLDYNDKVIYIKSFSKIFMPGLRLAFMIIPLKIYNDVLTAKHTSDISTSGLIQRAFHLYLSKGIWQKHIKFMRNVYEKRFNTMTECLARYMPEEIKYTQPQGGLNFWLSLPNGYSSEALYKACLKYNILIVPGSVFYVNQRDNEYFRLNIASVYNNELKRGVETLSILIEDFLNENKKNRIKPITPTL